MITTLNFFGGRSTDNCDELINCELGKIQVWLKVNKLSLNIQKTKAMVFHTPQRKVRVPKLRIEDHDIEIVEEFNFLGIILDKNLNWKSHISHICKKISKTTGILCRLKRLVPQDVLLTLYNSLILPYLNYGILVWGHKSTKLVTLQKKIVRIITNSNFNAHFQPLF